MAVAVAPDGSVAVQVAVTTPGVDGAVNVVVAPGPETLPAETDHEKPSASPSGSVAEHVSAVVPFTSVVAGAAVMPTPLGAWF